MLHGIAKYRVLIVSCGLMFLFGGAITFAATTTSTTTNALPETRVDDVATQIESRTPMTEEEPAATSPLPPRTQDRLQNLSANLSNRHEAAISRLQQISDRVAQRISRANEQGVDTASAARALSVATTSLQNAATSLNTIDAQVQQFVYSPEPQTSWQQVRATYELSEQAILDGHTALRIAINELKQAPASVPAS